MFIQSMEGSWFSHPFLKAGFLLTDPADVEALLSSKIDGVLIDTEKGLDIEGQKPRVMPIDATSEGAKPAAAQRAVPAESAESATAPQTLPTITALASDAPCSMAEEFGRANIIADHAKRVMTELYDQARLGRIVNADTLVPLVEDIAGSLARNRSALTSILRLKTKDEYTYVHSVAVSALMINLGREIGGFDPAMLRDMGVAGLLHDVGKMAMPEAVLGKPGELTNAEYSIMKTHPERGHALLRRSRDVPGMALDVCLHHHERVNGTGYPGRLKGGRITLFSRMGAICDVYDALTSNRPYKTAWGANQALKTMFSWRGHFDTDILTAFIRSVGIYPVGTLVKLRSGHLAFVLDINDADLTKPIVRAFFSIAHGAPIPPQDINLLTNAEGDAIVSSEDPDAWDLGDWEKRWSALAA
ncbi:putative nucleotidyltransferase with HDIG domain [Sphingosinicella soli]|uniref:Putative nucleotidyltransferase with HDIG domain n=2 Tax=Sphingosinicella soli TaxID=333708 RepID=A0A7W7B4J5_9SPHN|nr:putative nucleotidyltransferase with HDIG domain [Sphingosinicella soli]